MGSSVDVVVPTYGNWAITRSCLDHLAAQSIPHRVILVDDAGPDDTAERVRADFPNVHLIALATNSGFAAACNAGIRAGTADIVVLVNNDVDAGQRMLEHLVTALDADTTLGSAAPLLLRPDGTVDALGLCADVTMAGFVRLAGAPTSARENSRLLGPYGAVAAYRRSALETVGLLDEGIFMYGEELDLALRMSAAGWGSVAVPESTGVHLGGATSGRGSATQRRRSGFGRGYLLRAWGVLRGRHALRAVVTEAIVCAGDLVLSRDLASMKGRLAGWRAGALAAPRPRSVPGVDTSIGFVHSMRLRLGSYQDR
ncbi:MAG: glycosyltransferase family 2 protein [Ramlibacter sp.]|nr:glycosyltransferase family 2 protein [Cryobacterium sp.]